MNWPDVAAGAVGALATVATVALGIRLRGKAPPSGAGLRGVGRVRGTRPILILRIDDDDDPPPIKRQP